jgi:hypothetical protein
MMTALLIALAAFQMTFSGFGGGPIAVSQLARQADAVVEASLAAIPPKAEGAPVSVQLTVRRWLKGQPAGGTLVVAVPPILGSDPVLPPGIVGQNGIWFVAKTDSALGYKLLPRAAGLWKTEAMYLPIPARYAGQPPGATLDEELLSYVVGWYQEMSSPRPLLDDDDQLAVNFDPSRAGVREVDKKVLTASIAPLLKSPSRSQQCVGLALALRLGSDTALASVAQDLEELASSPKFGYLKGTIATTYLGGAWEPTLAALAALHSPGLDNTVAQALERVGGKGIAPAMATLLDSPDSEAQLRASRYFSLYAMFADAQGNFRDSGPAGPFATADTRQFTPKKDSGLTADAYAAFWKSWWARNRTALGFASQ